MGRTKTDPQKVLEEALREGDHDTAAYERQVIANSGACNPELGPNVGGSSDPVAMTLRKVQALIKKDAYQGMQDALNLDNTYGTYTTLIMGAANTVALNEQKQYNADQVQEAIDTLDSLRK
jgi:hypothetical protein